MNKMHKIAHVLFALLYVSLIACSIIFFNHIDSRIIVIIGLIIIALASLIIIKASRSESNNLLLMARENLLQEAYTP